MLRQQSYHQAENSILDTSVPRYSLPTVKFHRIDVSTPSLTKILLTQNADPGTLEQSVDGPLLMNGSIGTVRLAQLARLDYPDWHA